jgi:hypothetical protein
MRLLILILALGTSGCAISNTAATPTGSPGFANSGAGAEQGRTAGSSVGGGPLGAGTDDNPAGAK